MLCCGCRNSDPKGGRSVIPNLWRDPRVDSSQIQCPGVCDSPSLPAPLCPVGMAQGTCSFWEILVLCHPSVPRTLSSLCIPAVGIIPGAALKGHTLFPSPLAPLWDQLLFHFCFKGLFRGCQLDPGEQDFSAAVCREQPSPSSLLALAAASSFSR